MLKIENLLEFDALTDEQFEAYQNLKNHLVNPPILEL